MKSKYDPEADAIYIYLGEKPYAYGTDLDDERRIDYAADDSPIGMELLCVSEGVNLDGLPYVDEIAKVIEAEGIKAYETIQYSYAASGNSSAVFEVKLALPTTGARQQHTVGLKQEATV